MSKPNYQLDPSTVPPTPITHNFGPLTPNPATAGVLTGSWVGQWVSVDHTSDFAFQISTAPVLSGSTQTSALSGSITIEGTLDAGLQPGVVWVGTTGADRFNATGSIVGGLIPPGAFWNVTTIGGQANNVPSTEPLWITFNGCNARAVRPRFTWTAGSGSMVVSMFSKH
jgi:hypothetical protein